MPEERRDELPQRLEALLHDHGLSGRVEALHRLTGGASRETWAFDLAVDGDDRRRLILQRTRGGTVSGGPGMEGEAALLRAAASAGVPVPSVLAADGGDELGGACLVMERLAGETIARKLLRDEEWASARDRLVADAASALAGIHSLDLEGLPPLRHADQLEEMAALLHGFGEPHPAFELAIRWLAANRPPAPRSTVVHGDFRLGNLLLDHTGLAGVLDWELAHRGDPVEDLGWFCVRAWRFGSPLPAGGVGTREQLVAAYEAAGGASVDADALRWWEVLGTLKWGLICIVQSHAHLGGATRSVELAAIGRRVCENEWDVLALLPGPTLAPAPPEPRDVGVGLHGRPTAAELVEAVREWLDDDVRGAADGRVAFHARVAVNALATVERELALGPHQEDAHRARLAAIGCASDAALAQRIRAGDLDGRLEEVRASVAEDVAAKLAVANPRWLEPDG